MSLGLVPSELCFWEGGHGVWFWGWAKDVQKLVLGSLGRTRVLKIVIFEIIRSDFIFSIAFLFCEVGGNMKKKKCNFLQS